MKKRITILLLFCFSIGLVNKGTTQQLSENYLQLQRDLAQGWNTWSYESMLSHVLLPQGIMLRLNFRQTFINTVGDPLMYLSHVSPDTSDMIQPIAHTFDGSYTELLIKNWKGNTIRVQSAAQAEDLVVLVTPVVKSPNIGFQVEAELGILWNLPGQVKKQDQKLIAQTPDHQTIIQSTKENIEVYHPYPSPYLVVKGDDAFGLYSGKKKTLTEVKKIIAEAKQTHHKYAQKYGELAEAFKAIQSVMGWNTLFDKKNERVITPVSRVWNEAWQGFVLFEWDTYLGAYLMALDHKALAYSNAIAVTKWPNPNGNIGHYQMGDGTIALMSQPPIGSTICWKIFEKYQEEWFLEEIFPELLNWNRWYHQNRNNQGYLAWGGWKGAEAQIAAWESGLDNAPMYEGVEMLDRDNASVMQLADVGLNSLFTADCQNLAKIARQLGKTAETQELLARAEQYRAATQTLWEAEHQFYLNKHLITQAPSLRLSPTLFYPMIAGIPSEDQAQQMIKHHFYNPDEFYGPYLLPSCAKNDPSYDNVYWRGAIWPPLNFLTYLGLEQYDQTAASDLANKSYDLFIQAWQKHGCIFENINSAKGVASPDDQIMADHFYTWGALMGIMKFMEAGHYEVENTENK